MTSGEATHLPSSFLNRSPSAVIVLLLLSFLGLEPSCQEKLDIQRLTNVAPSFALLPTLAMRKLLLQKASAAGTSFTPPALMDSRLGTPRINLPSEDSMSHSCKQQFCLFTVLCGLAEALTPLEILSRSRAGMGFQVSFSVCSWHLALQQCSTVRQMCIDLSPQSPSKPHPKG